MIIKPRIRGFICTTAHPKGCAAHVDEQIATVKARGAIANGPKRVLVIGASGGYGLASRIVSAFGSGAATLGVSFEKAPEGDRTATAGWYNNRAFEARAHAAGLYAKTLDGDAFSDQMKAQVIERIKGDLGQIDLLVYSLASPVRQHPRTGVLYRSAIKPIGEVYHVKTLNVDRGVVTEVDLEPATPTKSHRTVAVMGGEDWEFWIDALQSAGVLAPGFRTMSYTYIGTRTHVADLLARDARQGEGRSGSRRARHHATVGAIARRGARCGAESSSSVRRARRFPWCRCTARCCFA